MGESINGVTSTGHQFMPNGFGCTTESTVVVIVGQLMRFLVDLGKYFVGTMSMEDQHDRNVGISPTNGPHEYRRSEATSRFGASERRIGDLVFAIFEGNDDWQAKLGARGIGLHERLVVDGMKRKTFTREFAQRIGFRPSTASGLIFFLAGISADVLAFWKHRHGFAQRPMRVGCFSWWPFEQGVIGKRGPVGLSRFLQVSENGSRFLECSVLRFQCAKTAACAGTVPAKHEPQG